MNSDFSKIRQIAKNAITPDFGAYFIVSNLNWLRYERQVNELLNLVPTPSKVLDIGCGLGMTSSMIKSVKSGVEVVGVDINQRSTWGTYQNQYDVKYSVGDALDLKFGDDEFDIVVSFGVIEHVEDDGKFIKENLRVLKGGGIGFILNIPNRYSINEFLAKKFGLDSHETRYTISQIELLLKSNWISNFSIKRRFLIPAQVNRINRSLGALSDKFHAELDYIDRLLCRFPLNFFSQVFDVIYKKDL